MGYQRDSPLAKTFSAYSRQEGSVQPPDKHNLDEEGLRRFEQYITWKQADKWKKFELIRLCQAIKYEQEGERVLAQVIEEGYMQGGKRNPLLFVWKDYMTRMEVIYKSLGMTTLPTRVMEKGANPERGDEEAPMQLL